MENQHRKITGYRELNAEEVALMNEIKALGPLMEAVLLKVQAHVQKQRNFCESGILAEDTETKIAAGDEHSRLADATPERFLALAKTEMQTGLMYATRAVAQPTFF